MRLTPLTLAVTLALVAPTGAQADETANVAAAHAAIPVATAYWSTVPGVPTIEQTCGSLPPLKMEARPGAGWAYPRIVWDGEIIAAECDWGVSTTWFAQMDAASATWDTPAHLTQREICRAIVHEYGHLLGLEHAFRGDPATVMEYGNRPPAECAAAFPAPQPEAEEPAAASSADRSTARSRCAPAWSQRSTRRVRRLYTHGRRQAARRVYRRWAKAHRAKAGRLHKRGRVCVRERVVTA